MEIFLHELGHAKLYLDNYKKNDSVSYKEAFERRRLDYNSRYDSLPIPGVISNMAEKYWKQSKGDNVEDRIQDMIRMIKSEYFSNKGPRQGVSFDEDLFKANLYQYGVFANPEKMNKMLDDQRQQEENFSDEKDVDNFAVDFLKKHWEELGLDKK